MPVFVVDEEDCPRNVYIESVRDAYLGLNFVLLKLYLLSYFLFQRNVLYFNDDYLSRMTPEGKTV